MHQALCTSAEIAKVFKLKQDRYCNEVIKEPVVHNIGV